MFFTSGLKTGIDTSNPALYERVSNPPPASTDLPFNTSNVVL